MNTFLQHVNFSGFFLSVAVYSLGYALEIAHNDVQSILIAVRVEYFGLSFIGPPFPAFYITLCARTVIIAPAYNRADADSSGYTGCSADGCLA